MRYMVEMELFGSLVKGYMSGSVEMIEDCLRDGHVL
jgi:hypothetical protein